MGEIIKTRPSLLRRAMSALRNRRLPWALRWVKYVRISKPLQSIRVIIAALRNDSKLGSLLLHTYGEEFLRETLTACQSAGMRPFLAFGTLLGHHRDGGFIKHDADIDFGILESDFGKIDALVSAMKEQGYVVRSNNEHEVSFYKPFFHTLLIDFFRFYEKDRTFVYFDTRGDTVFEYAFAHDILEDFCDVRFLGCLDAYVPQKAEEFLTTSYGDWKTPRKEFNNIHDHPNMRVV